MKWLLLIIHSYKVYFTRNMSDAASISNFILFHEKANEEGKLEITATNAFSCGSLFI